jgi:hypothetical protein
MYFMANHPERGPLTMASAIQTSTGMSKSVPANLAGERLIGALLPLPVSLS